MNIRVDLMSITVTSRLQASAARCPSLLASAVMSVPGFAGCRELRIRTGMFLETAGRMVAG